MAEAAVRVLTMERLVEVLQSVKDMRKELHNLGKANLAKDSSITRLKKKVSKLRKVTKALSGATSEKKAQPWDDIFKELYWANSYVKLDASNEMSPKDLQWTMPTSAEQILKAIEGELFEVSQGKKQYFAVRFVEGGCREIVRSWMEYASSRFALKVQMFRHLSEEQRVICANTDPNYKDFKSRFALLNLRLRMTMAYSYEIAKFTYTRTFVNQEAEGTGRRGSAGTSAVTNKPTIDEMVAAQTPFMRYIIEDTITQTQLRNTEMYSEAFATDALSEALRNMKETDTYKTVLQTHCIDYNEYGKSKKAVRIKSRIKAPFEERRRTTRKPGKGDKGEAVATNVTTVEGVVKKKRGKKRKASSPSSSSSSQPSNMSAELRRNERKNLPIKVGKGIGKGAQKKKKKPKGAEHQENVPKGGEKEQGQKEDEAELKRKMEAVESKKKKKTKEKTGDASAEKLAEKEMKRKEKEGDEKEKKRNKKVNSDVVRVPIVKVPILDLSPHRPKIKVSKVKELSCEVITTNSKPPEKTRRKTTVARQLTLLESIDRGRQAEEREDELRKHRFAVHRQFRKRRLEKEKEEQKGKEKAAEEAERKRQRQMAKRAEERGKEGEEQEMKGNEAAKLKAAQRKAAKRDKKADEARIKEELEKSNADMKRQEDAKKEEAEEQKRQATLAAESKGKEAEQHAGSSAVATKAEETLIAKIGINMQAALKLQKAAADANRQNKQSSSSEMSSEDEEG